MALDVKPTRSLVDQLIARSPHLIHKLKAKDSTGRWAYYYVYVHSSKEQRFLSDLKLKGDLDLVDYGVVIGSCYGEEPTESLKASLRERYNFDV